jgi:transcriptional regulator GlxA family with amidase domain
MRVPVGWIRRATATARRVSSICSGGFLLARAGVLEGKACTTHWKMIPLLREWSPGSRVLENRLFVRDGNIVTSAGLASGIDLTLACLQEDWGARVAAKVAREMVVYVRRNGETEQESVYLQHRDHVHPGVHRVQDWIVEHPDERPTLDTLAEIAAVSPRHLTRLFREATGITLVAFAHKVKLEVARALAENPALTMDAIAARCGFGDARHLRRLWRAENGTTIGRRRAAGRPPENSTLRDLEGRQR